MDCSRRLRSRITDCESSGLPQKFGSAIFFSVWASCWRLPGASKILPEIVNLLPQREKFALEFFDELAGDAHTYRSTAARKLSRRMMAAREIIAQAQANQSPCRV